MEATFRGTRAELLALLHTLPAVLSGSEEVQVLLANAFLRKAHEAAVAKGERETGDDGVEWHQLAKATRKKRRQHGTFDEPHGPILKEYGKLLAQLAPGEKGQTSDRLHHEPDAVRIDILAEENGINKASLHHHGFTNWKGSKVPARRLWHTEGHMTTPWKEALLAAMAEGLPGVIGKLLA